MGQRERRHAPRRLVAAGIAAGVILGAAAGATLLTGAAPPTAVSGPRPVVLHVAPALVDAGADLELSAATMCRTPGRASCTVDAARAWVRPQGAAGWSPVPGHVDDGAYRFDVSGTLVPEGGFDYWLEFRTQAGAAEAYPPGGARAAIRVLTVTGLPERAFPAIDWDAVSEPDGVALSMRYGSHDGQAGIQLPEGDGEITGLGSFDIGPDGSIYVDDWVNARVQVFSRSGRFERAFRSPVHEPADLAVADDGSLVLGTLGEDAEAFELSPTGAVIGRYPVGYGIVSRVAIGPDGPKAMVGPSQWAAVRTSPGRPLAPELQARLQSAVAPQPDGAVGVSQSLPGGRIAFAWVRGDGSRAGAVLALPRGVQPGSDFFVRPLDDGGALAARGVWDATHFGVVALRFDALGRVVSSSLLPEPSHHQVARFSTVRYRAPGEVLVAVDRAHELQILRFEVR
ncbi:MAG: hypothetical protein ACXWZU_06175 [Actinomycetota bacterium]